MNKYLTKILEVLTKFLNVVKRYQTIIFVVFLAVMYGFLIFRINTLSSQQPTDEQVSAQAKIAQSPHIDDSVVQKIKQLQDNSVQVKSLFSQIRNDPFSECLDSNGKPTKPPHCAQVF